MQLGPGPVGPPDPSILLPPHMALGWDPHDASPHPCLGAPQGLCPAPAPSPAGPWQWHMCLHLCECACTRMWQLCTRAGILVLRERLRARPLHACTRLHMAMPAHTAAGCLPGGQWLCAHIHTRHVECERPPAQAAPAPAHTCGSSRGVRGAPRAMCPQPRHHPGAPGGQEPPTPLPLGHPHPCHRYPLLAV